MESKKEEVGAMSLEDPTVTTEKKSKKQQARDLSLQYKNMLYHQARAKIMEEIPCSRSTATKALKWMESCLLYTSPSPRDRS